MYMMNEIASNISYWFFAKYGFQCSDISIKEASQFYVAPNWVINCFLKAYASWVT